MLHNYNFEGDLGDLSKDKEGFKEEVSRNRGASDYVRGGCEKV